MNKILQSDFSIDLVDLTPGTLSIIDVIQFNESYRNYIWVSNGISS